MASVRVPRFNSAMPATAIGAALVAALVSTASAQTYTEKTLYSFCAKCRDGASSLGVVIDPAGNLFGTAFGGKTNAGLVYEFVPGSAKYSVLYNFCSQTACADGSEPIRVNLVIDTNGNLYGTTSKGGNSNDAGVVFELVHKGSSYQEKRCIRSVPIRIAPTTGAPRSMD